MERKLSKQNNRVESDLFVTYYDQQQYKDRIEVTDISDIEKKKKVTWVDVLGLETEKVEELSAEFGLHPLVIEDILNPAQRPKFEVYEDYMLFVIKDFSYYQDSEEIKQEQLSIVLGADFVLSFQEKKENNFSFINQKLATEDSQLRNKGADYLAYRLIDTIVDDYFLVIEKLGDFIFNLEERLIDESSPEILNNLHQLKREVISLQRLISPLKGLIYSSTFKDNQLFTENNFIYWRDIDDHLSTVLDKVRTFREIINSMLDTYLSNVNDNMNQVMQVLTVISTIFIPLSFLTGLYGMNFKYMPELEYQYSYPTLLGLMIVIAVTMLVYFKKNNWL